MTRTHEKDLEMKELDLRLKRSNTVIKVALDAITRLKTNLNEIKSVQKESPGLKEMSKPFALQGRLLVELAEGTLELLESQREAVKSRIQWLKKPKKGR